MQLDASRVVSDSTGAESAFDGFDLINPERYRTKGYPHAEWTFLRQHHPVYRVECPGIAGFWAVTKAADIIEISRQPRLWLNAPRFAIFTREPGEQPPANPLMLKHLVNMDPPQHGAYRSILSKHFTPRAVRRWNHRLQTQELPWRWPGGRDATGHDITKDSGRGNRKDVRRSS